MTENRRAFPRIWACSCVSWVLLFLGPAWAGGLAVRRVVLADNGDGDGYADTRETVSLRLELQNTSGGVLSGITVRLFPHDAGLSCLTDSEITVGSLAPGEIRLTDEAFTFTVGDVDRATLGLSATDNLSITFDVLVEALPTSPRAYPPTLTLDLDLDVSLGGRSTVFFESFENSTLGAFESDNVDQGKSNLAASDGYRCQYNDPDRPGSITSQSPSAAAICYLGASPLHADAAFWGLSGPAFSPLGGRGFSGFHSLVFGLDLGPPKNWTTPLATLDAVRTSQPIHLGWDGASPLLSMKHQVSLVDGRPGCAALPIDQAYDRGVVMVQLADAGGAPAGPWVKLEPYQNVYDRVNAEHIFNCAFDPIDDGSTEDDFHPTSAQYGPSSTCYPEPTFTELGETSNPFGAANLGRADGPGLEGQWGIGTWIESKFDLGRFRGRSIRLRFLASTIKGTASDETWEDLFSFNPNPCDDGWWIDDVSVVGVLGTGASVAVDVKPNTGLPGFPAGDLDGDGFSDICDNCPGQINADQEDLDLDATGDACDFCPTDPTNTNPDGDLFCGIWDNCPFVASPDPFDGDGDLHGAACDCDDGDPTVYPDGIEANDGKDNNCPGDPGHGSIDETSSASFFQNKTLYKWPPQPGATQYRAARARSASFAVGCLAFSPSSNSFVIDTAQPLPGGLFFYLNRATLPNKGSWGKTSAGAERVVPCAP